MANELIKEKIIVDQKIGKEFTQVLLEGDIIVPDVKPDMSVILQTDAKVVVSKVDLSNDRINFMGRLDISVLYLAKGSEKPVHSISISTHIDDFINMEGITKDMWAEVKLQIANIDYKMLNDRKVNYRAVLDVVAIGESSQTHDVVVSIADVEDNQCLKSMLSLNKVVENKEDRFIVKDEIVVPTGKPNIREILQCSIAVNQRDTKASNGKVTISGEIIVTTLYKGDSDDSMIEFLENEIPFNGVIDAASAKEDMFADVTLQLQDQYIQIRPDADGEDRLLEVEASIGTIIKLSSLVHMDILEDAYIINKNLNITKNKIHYPRLVCRNKNQAPIKEIIQIHDDTPDMLQIFRVKGTPHLEDVKVMDDKIAVEGSIEVDILYVAEDDNTPLYSNHTVLPYKQIIETKGSDPSMDVSIQTNIDHIGFNMLSGREVEVRILLSFNTQVNEEKETRMITDIEFYDIDPEQLKNMASITVYSVQKGDTLWKIAKQYNATVKEIATINDLEETEKLNVGQKLIILKKVC